MNIEISSLSSALIAGSVSVAVNATGDYGGLPQIQKMDRYIKSCSDAGDPLSLPASDLSSADHVY